MKRRVVWLVLAVVLVGAIAVGSWPRSGVETDAERAERLATQIQCPTCQGLSVAESSSPLAQSSEAEIERLVGEGRSDAEVRSYFESRYGPSALVSPEPSGFAWLVWLAPIAFAVVAVAGLVLTLRRWRRNPDEQSHPGLDPGSRDLSSRGAGILDPGLRRDDGKWSHKWVYAAIGLFAVGAVVFVVNIAAERQPGEETTGDIALDTNSLLARAQAQTAGGEAADALATYDAVLEQDPSNAQALAYRGWLIRLGGFPDVGLESIDKAIDVQPDYADARFFRGFILLRDKAQPQAAVTELEASLAANPPEEMRPLIEQVLTDARAQATP